jgi:hypothetical protein
VHTSCIRAVPAFLVVHPRMHLFREKPAGAVAPARTHGRRVKETKGGNTLLRKLHSYTCTHTELRYPLDVPDISHRRPCLARHSRLARVSTARVAPSLLCTINCDFPTTSLLPCARVSSASGKKNIKNIIRDMRGA